MRTCGRNQAKGFGILEIAVAVGMAILLIAVVAYFVLENIERAKVAELIENLENVRTAFNSAYTKNQGIRDENEDGDYIDDLVKIGFLSNIPTYPKCASWHIKKIGDTCDRGVYIIHVDMSLCEDSERTKLLRKVDEHIDDGKRESGNFRF
ncbi:MAG: hypothetical protein QXP49_05860 [Nitrososphaerota archaeon]